MILKRQFYKRFLVSLLILLTSIGVSAQTKQIAFTIDDLPLNGPQFDAKRLQIMTEKTLNVIKKNKIPTVGFINESLLYGQNDADQRIAILKMWHDVGVELGNHTFSHLGFSNATLAEYEDDFIRGDSITKMLMSPAKPRYFRHPYLQMGATRELEDAFEKFIAERGYKAVPATVDTMDWMFLAAYAKSLNDKDKAFQKMVSNEYLKFVKLRLEAAERSSNNLFGRNIKQILVLHVNELNADNFDAVVKIYRDAGYQFITVEEALKDEIYRSPEKYSPTSYWLEVWANQLGKRIESPQPPDFIQKIYQGK